MFDKILLGDQWKLWRLKQWLIKQVFYFIILLKLNPKLYKFINLENLNINFIKIYLQLDF